MRTIGKTTANTTVTSNNTRYSVTVAYKGKTLYTTVGMLFKSVNEAENWVIRTLTNLGVPLPEGATVTATVVTARHPVTAD